MKNNINNEDFDSMVDGTEDFELCPQLAGFIVRAALDEAMNQIMALSNNDKFTIHDVLSIRTIEYLEKRALLVSFEVYLLHETLELNGCEMTIWVRKKVFQIFPAQ